VLNSILKNLRSMQTRESIVQRLFNEGLITAEEAVVLLKEDVKIIQVPNQRSLWIGPGPSQPYVPYTSGTAPNPMFPYCDWTYRPDQMPVYCTTGTDLNKNYTDK
jgi:hypothetical protein